MKSANNRNSMKRRQTEACFADGGTMRPLKERGVDAYSSSALAGLRNGGEIHADLGGMWVNAKRAVAGLPSETDKQARDRRLGMTSPLPAPMPAPAPVPAAPASDAIANGVDAIKGYTRAAQMKSLGLRDGGEVATALDNLSEKNKPKGNAAAASAAASSGPSPGPFVTSVGTAPAPPFSSSPSGGIGGGGGSSIGGGGGGGIMGTIAKDPSNFVRGLPSTGFPGVTYSPETEEISSRMRMRNGGEIHADLGGMWANVKRAVAGLPSETDTEARNRRLGNVSTSAAPAPAPVAPAPQPDAIADGIAAIKGETRAAQMKALGLRDGGEMRMDSGGMFDSLRNLISPTRFFPNTASTATLGVRGQNGGVLVTGHGGVVPGTGTGDKIPAKYEPGEFVVSNAMLDAQPELRGHLRSLRKEVLADKGMTPEQADAKVLRGTGLRAEYGYDELLKPRKAQNGQLQTSGQGLPGNAAQRTGGATGSWGDSTDSNSGQSPVPRVQRGVLRTIADQAFPITSTILRGRGEDATDAAARGNWGAAIGHGIRGGLEGAGALGADIVTPLARGLDALAPVGRGMVNAAHTAITNDSTPLVAAPKPSAAPVNVAQTAQKAAEPDFTAANNAKLDAANAAIPAPVAAKLGDVRNIDNTAGTQDVFSNGTWRTVSTPEAKAARGLRDEQYQQRLRDEYDAATTGPLGWKTRADAHDAREKAADDARRFEASLAGLNPAQQVAARQQRLGTTVGLDGERLKADSLLRMTQMNNDTQLRTTGMTTDASMSNSRLSSAVAAQNARLAQFNADREYAMNVAKYGVDVADKNRAASESSAKAMNDRMERMWRTNVDGKDVPDTAKIAQYTQNIQATLPDYVSALLKENTPEAKAKAMDLQRRGPAALSDTDHELFRTLQLQQDRLEQTKGAFVGSTHNRSASLLGYRQKAGTSLRDGAFQAENGSMAPAKHLMYNEPGNLVLPDWFKQKDDTLTRGLRAQ